MGADPVRNTRTSAKPTEAHAFLRRGVIADMFARIEGRCAAGIRVPRPCVATASSVAIPAKYVNMAYVILKPDTDSAEGHENPGGAPHMLPLSLEERPEIRYIELLFFAYRDFVSDPDAVLAKFGFGRAHHRIVHFVNRHPGMRVADLLDILKITKQSLGRVLKQLIDNGFIEQLPGPQDRRQRLLYPTAAGRALSLRLLGPQEERIAAALEPLSPEERAGALKFLRGIINAGERDKAATLIESPPR